MFEKLVHKAVGLANVAVYGPPPAGTPASLDEVALVGLDGAPLDRSALKGRVLLFVNVASRCGLTPQYEKLVELDRRYRERGLTILGVPCNQFLGQEPGSAEEIASFCAVNYGVDFPLLEKQEVNGAGRSALYQFLVGHTGGADISWNFEKILVGRDGAVKARFAPRTGPLAEEVVRAIEAELG